jgi:uncharacterized membrane protein
MSPLRAHVEKGRLVLDEPTTLPEGTVLELVADDQGDDLSDEERRALHQALSASCKSAEDGQLRPAAKSHVEINNGITEYLFNKPVDIKLLSRPDNK